MVTPQAPQTPQAPSKKFNIELLPLDGIIPYWRNPRTITDDAVNMVAESIRQYGYQQPIVVDGAHTIIIGHTRYAALRRLGYTEVYVRVETSLSPEQVKQLRAVDNRAGEYTSWDFDKLSEELTTLDSDLMRRFFPEIIDGDTIGEITVDLSGGGDDYIPGTVEAVSDDDTLAEFICPKCFHQWEMTVTPADIKKGVLKA